MGSTYDLPYLDAIEIVVQHDVVLLSGVYFQNSQGFWKKASPAGNCSDPPAAALLQATHIGEVFGAALMGLFEMGPNHPLGIRTFYDVEDALHSIVDDQDLRDCPAILLPKGVAVVEEGQVTGDQENVLTGPLGIPNGC